MVIPSGENAGIRVLHTGNYGIASPVKWLEQTTPMGKQLSFVELTHANMGEPDIFPREGL